MTDWPTSGTSPYGSCNGGWSTACSYVYGQARAHYSYGLASATNATVASSSGSNGPIGTYSTASQWDTIAGLNAQTTTAGLGLTTPLPDWVAGPRASLKVAQSNCSTGGFTGAEPTLAQYSSGGYDADLRCS